jgi:acetyltransferase
MSTYRLERVFSPRSIALVGASPRQKSVGRAILRNLREGGWSGPLHLVNPKHREIDGVPTLRDLSELSAAPDLAIISAPMQTVPDIVAKSAEIGVGAAVIITAGLGHGSGSLANACETAARRKGLRLIGPNCLGVLAPQVHLNASFAARMPGAGELALISQSGAIAAGIIDWAAQRQVGFSAIASIGDQLDVDFGDLLDYFALDRATRAILLYIESIKNARKFMSAARAAARGKPVVVVKAGRQSVGAKAAETHTGALAGADAVYAAAFHRAGLLRVLDLGELFDAAETLGRVRHLNGKRLAILTNGGGIGVLAADRLADLNGMLAELSSATRSELDRVLPPTWSKSNPVDIIGDADEARYTAALEALLAAPEIDAVLVANVQTAIAPAAAIATSVADRVRRLHAHRPQPKPVFALWVGADLQIAATFKEANVPHFETETDAVRGFMQIVQHRAAIDTLMQTPPSLPRDIRPDRAAARDVVEKVCAEGRTWLDPLEASAMLCAYGIATVETTLTHSPDEAATAAARFLNAGQSVVAKILSHDIVHKSEVGGVRFNLTSAETVHAAVADIIADAKRARPDAHITGVTLQPMIVRPKAHELIIGIADDPTFGPVIVFGRGGTGVEVINDKALALPPLDLKLARDLINRTRVARLLRGYRDVPAVDEDELALTLVKIAQLAADLPEVRDLDINPLLADASGLIGLDARVAVAPVDPKFKGSGHPRFAVRPYPVEWERALTLTDGQRILVRPIRPEDEALYPVFLQHVSAEDLRLRFFSPIRAFDHAFIARFTQIDYARAMAFVALDEGSRDLLGVVRLHSDANYESGEFAILLRSDLKGHGLGWKLMHVMISYAQSEGLKRIEGQVLSENTVMLRMCAELGFQIAQDRDDPSIMVVTLALPGSAM